MTDIRDRKADVEIPWNDGHVKVWIVSGPLVGRTIQTGVADLDWTEATAVWLEFDLPSIDYLFDAYVMWLLDPAIYRIDVRSRWGGDWPPQPITTTHLRRVPISQIVFDFLPLMARGPSGDPPDARQWAKLRRRIATPNIARSAATQLEKVAAVYAAAVIAGDRAPTQRVADELDYSRSHAARLVTNARKAKLLGPAKPGKGGM